MVMKRLFIIAAALACGFMLGSCGGSISPDGYANQGEKVAPQSAALSSYEQKAKLEEAGKALLAELDEEYWEDTADFFQALAEHFAELGEDAMGAFEEWSDDIEEAFEDRKIKGGKMTLKTTAALSKVPKGTFREVDEVFEFTPGGSAVKIMTYVDGLPVTITMTHGGESKAYEVESEHWKAGSDWDARYYDDEKVTESDETRLVKIPSWVNIEVKQTIIVRANWKVNIRFTDANNDGKIVLEEDNADIETELKAAGYTLHGTDKYYNKNGIAYSTETSTLSKGSKTLVTDAIEGSAEISGNKVKMPQKAKGAIDIMGLVQAKGTIDYAKGNEIDGRLDPSGSEEDYARLVSEMEECLDVSIYYDKKGGKQAWLGLEPFRNERNRSWSYRPVIRFADETSYVLGEFFNKDNFSSFLDALQSWQEDIAYYYGGY